jgi:hypothetical protein
VGNLEGYLDANIHRWKYMWEDRKEGYLLNLVTIPLSTRGVGIPQKDKARSTNTTSLPRTSLISSFSRYLYDKARYSDSE